MKCYYDGQEYKFVKNVGSNAVIKDSKGQEHIVSRLKVNFIKP
jgi:hypothetical protein